MAGLGTLFVAAGKAEPAVRHVVGTGLGVQLVPVSV